MDRHRVRYIPGGKQCPGVIGQKKKAFQKAIDANESIIRAIQQMVITHKEIDIDRLDNLGDLLLKESSLLKKAKENSRVQQDGGKNPKQSKQT